MNTEEKYSNYSKEDGKILNKISNYYRLEINNEMNCSKCHTESKYGSNYCKQCGNELFKVVDKNLFNIVEKSKFNINNIKSYASSTNIFITSVSSILILFILSVIFNGMMDISLGKLGISISPLHTMLGMNLGSINITSSSLIGVGEVSVHLGVISLLIAPIISLVISNILFMKNKSNTPNELIINSIGVGIVYALFMAVISMISKIELNSYDMMNIATLLKVKFATTSIFINSFLIGFLSTFTIGYKKRIGKENIYINIFKKVINIFMIGYILVFIIVGILTISDSTYLYEFGISEYMKYINTGIVVSQLSVYMWGFANLIPMVIGDYTISIFNILNSNLFFDTKLIFIIVFILVSLIILIAGCNLKKHFKNNDKNVLLIFSIMYSFVMALISMLSKIDVGMGMLTTNVNNHNVITFGLPIIITIISSFIYSYILAFIGYKLYNFE
ncbi:hypothetical protein [Romboutsia hominis]|uniref:Brp/Blh beta-carotene 15,15'-monooxygenase n=1 Tax=Romboutsia hominis TaxID=1507512 RepID=A0A2P2BPP5_9FIRM|nr:hypothetical protein [Romboutsia hominis]CEI72325.1 Brp/Blh beta-carotene 15,15'-monooxygenase [Romboutsia hominis]